MWGYRGVCVPCWLACVTVIHTDVRPVRASVLCTLMGSPGIPNPSLGLERAQVRVGSREGLWPALSLTCDLYAPHVTEPPPLPGLSKVKVTAPPLLPVALLALLTTPLLPATAKPQIGRNKSQDADAPLRVVVRTGEEVTLDCEAQGSPPPLVTWTKDSHPVLPITDR